LFLAGAASEPQHQLYLAIGLASLVAAAGMILLLVVTRVQDIKVQWHLWNHAPEDAYTVIDQLRQTKQLTHKHCPLIMADWEGVTLQHADLHDANLQKINLETADLRYANMCHANLRSARLENADLSACDLSSAVLCYARLQKTNLRNAKLMDANLSAADLSDAQLMGADMRGAHCDAFTTLPDGRKWTPNVDWALFGVKWM
jgi:uncharacterized protein YjbI with pentapeptide repeats